MNKSRNSRPTRQTNRYSDMKWETNNNYSFYDDAQYYTTTPAGPASRVDLTKLKLQALRKYTKVYEVPGVHAQSSKEEMTSAVSRHWNAMPITEEAVLQNLLNQRVRGSRY